MIWCKLPSVNQNPKWVLHSKAEETFNSQTFNWNLWAVIAYQKTLKLGEVLQLLFIKLSLSYLQWLSKLLNKMISKIKAIKVKEAEAKLGLLICRVRWWRALFKTSNRRIALQVRIHYRSETFQQVFFCDRKMIKIRGD